MDNETKKVLSEQEHLLALTNHSGWHIARAKLSDRILELQNAFNIEDGTPDKMIVDLHARKIASGILFDWLKEIESSKEVIDENKPALDKSYIFKV